MKPLSAAEISGTWGTLLLPLNDDDSIDYTRLGEEADTLARSGVAGVYSNGTAGEFYTQDETEFDRISEILAEACERETRPFQIGASHGSPQIALARVKRSVAWRPSAFQVLLPDWSAPNLDEVIAFLERMAAAAEPIGLVVYNPPHAKKVLTPAEWQIVADRVPQVVGMKVGGGDARWFEAMRPLFSRLSVFVPGHKLASGFKLGAAGSYSNVACMSPRGAVRWFEMMQREPERALELEQRILRFFGAHIIPFIAEQKYSNSAADKLLAAIGGWAPIGTRLRWPYRWIDEGEARRLRAVAEADLPELFDEAYRNGQNLKNCRKNTSATT